jgi:hypothetical protein
MATKKKQSTLKTHLAELDFVVEKILAEEAGASPRVIKNARQAIEAGAKRLNAAAAFLDPIIRPASIFDPADPTTAGRVVALTLVAQKRYRLARIPLFYGAGVYALYYRGDAKRFPAYDPLMGKDHPIYVGKADPADAAAKDAIGQGRELAKRLREHAARIMKVHSTLDINDFECRFLICQSGFQRSAEAYLIEFFKPIWNSDTKICFGMSKHGDAADTRGNGRSPWFTMHPGIRWADDTKLADQKSKAQIEQDIAAHFVAHPPRKDIHEIFDLFMSSLQQLPMPEATEEIPADADEGIDLSLPAGTSEVIV